MATRATALGVANARAARLLAAPYAAGIDQWQARLAHIAASLQAGRGDPGHLQSLFSEALSIALEAAERLERLEAEIRLAPATVARHSRVEDVRNALTSVNKQVSSLQTSARLPKPSAPAIATRIRPQRPHSGLALSS